MDQIIATSEVFTPSQPARLTFIDRETINEQLVDALYTPGKQIAVFGYSGSGKTTVIRNKLSQVYEAYIYSQCITTTTIDSLLLDGFDQLNPYYISEASRSITNKISGELGAKYLNINLALSAESSEENSQKKERVLPPQLTAQNLAKFVGAVRACWVIDDFHKVSEDEKKKIAQLMKLFKDTSFEYPHTKIIVIGAVQTAKEIVDFDSELYERLEQIHVPLMSEEELRDIVTKGENLLNIEFGAPVKDKIISLSKKLGAVCHQLCLNICLANSLYETSRQRITFSDSDLNTAIEKYISSKSGTMKSKFESAVNVQRERFYENNKIILLAIVELDTDSASHAQILAKIKEYEPAYPSSNLTSYLKRLSNPEEDDSILYHDESANVYSVRNPFFKVYAAMRFKQDKGNPEKNISINISNNVISGNISTGGNIHIGNVNDNNIKTNK